MVLMLQNSKIEIPGKIIGKDENVNPMDHFEDNFGQKRGSEVKTNSAVSFVSNMLDIKEKCDPQMCNSDAYRRTKSTLQEYNGVKNGKPRGNDVTPRFCENSISNILKITNLIHLLFQNKTVIEEKSILKILPKV